MNKFLIYGFLILSYLVLAKSLSPSEFGISYIRSENDLSKLIPNASVSAILIDTHSTGFLIKTYYQKYKLIYGFKAQEELIVRVSNKFNKEQLSNIGMELFSRNEELIETTGPRPPGSLFVGDDHFGLWRENKEGQKVWAFYRAYRRLPKALGWGDWLPTLDFYNELNEHQLRHEVYRGKNHEFGSKGVLTQKIYTNYFKKIKIKKPLFRESLQSFFKENFYIGNEK